MRFTDDELYYLQNILWNFTDYMGGDDRDDHGFGILKHYRSLSEERKRIVYRLAGRLRRTYRRRQTSQLKKKNDV